MTAPLDRLLRPRSVAVIGGGSWCANVIRALRRFGHSGPVWPVHPTRDRVGGEPAFCALDALPGVPDAAFIGINRHATVEAVRTLSAMGAGGAVCFASGFAEARSELPDGDALQAALCEAAGDMAVLGPNCYGFVNALDGVALWPDEHGLVRVDHGVAILSQSSNIALTLTMQARGVPIAAAVTLGNQAQTGLAEIGGALLADDRVTALGLYLEGVGDLRALERLAAAARDRGKRIVAIKVGASAQARAASVSHTASLAGSDAGAEALLARLGIARVRGLGALLEALKIAHAGAVPAGNRLACLSCSGGEASLVADSALGRSLVFPPLEPAQTTALRAALGPRVALANPLDYHTYVWNDVPAMAATFAAMLQPPVQFGIVVVDIPRADRCDPAAWDCVIDAAGQVARTGRVPLALLATLPESLTEALAARIREAGLVPLAGIPDALDALDALARPVPADPAPVLLPGAGPVRTLDEAAAKAALGAHGLVLPEGAVAESPEAAGREAARLGGAVVLKGLGAAHKSEAGLVVLGLTGAGPVAARAAAMPARRFLVERLLTGAVAELLVGVTADPAHGYVLTIGAGGTGTELWRDTRSLLLPVRRAEVAAALDGLRIAPMLRGWRGSPAADRDAILDAVMAVADFVTAGQGAVQEVEVNPLLCRPDGAVAADALIVCRA